MKPHFKKWSLSLLGPHETGLGLLTDANSLFLLLLVFAQGLVLVVTTMSMLKEGGPCCFQGVVCSLSTENSLCRCSGPTVG